MTVTFEEGLEIIRRMKESRTHRQCSPVYPDEQSRKKASGDYQRQWRQDNPEKVKEWNRKQSERRRQNAELQKRYRERSLECYRRNKDRYNENRRISRAGSDKDTPIREGD